MDPLRTPPAVAAFLTVIRASQADAATQTMLHHSLRAWAPSYHYLRITLGAHHPLAVAMSRHSSLVAQTTLAVAQAILDGIADTFRCFFHLPWTRLEVSHAHLTATFPDLCAAYRLAGDTNALYARMRTLHTCLSAYCHAYRSPPGAVAPSPETLCASVTELDQYIIGMLHCFACNLQQSVLCPDTCMRTARVPHDTGTSSEGDNARWPARTATRSLGHQGGTSNIHVRGPRE